MTRPRRIAVCADDYALSPGVSAAIRELLAARRISATSVMTVFPEWPDEAPALAAVSAGLSGAIDVGLHLTLTDQAPLGALPSLAPQGRLPPLATLYARAVARCLPLGEVEAELERQLAAFSAVWGRPPSHIDGHHHVHQLPGIRDLVVRAAARFGPGGTWVRVCHEPLARLAGRGGAIGKAALIGAFGRATARVAARSGVPVNHGFSGVYDLANPPADMARLFSGFLAGVGAGHLVMCHPGQGDALLAARDAVTGARALEHAFLAGPDWPHLLEKANLNLGPLLDVGRTNGHPPPE
jgi:predicted glycoside hydrolase/deacetylase ChbG (UPF0249 family)